MRSVNLRQLQRHFYSEIKDLPILVTKMDRHKKVTPFCIVVPADFPINNPIIVQGDPMNVPPLDQREGQIAIIPDKEWEDLMDLQLGPEGHPRVAEGPGGAGPILVKEQEVAGFAQLDENNRLVDPSPEPGSSGLVSEPQAKSRPFWTDEEKPDQPDHLKIATGGWTKALRKKFFPGGND